MLYVQYQACPYFEQTFYRYQCCVCACVCMCVCVCVLQDPNVLAVQANEILTAIIQGMRKEEPRWDLLLWQ